MAVNKIFCHNLPTQHGVCAMLPYNKHLIKAIKKRFDNESSLKENKEKGRRESRGTSRKYLASLHDLFNATGRPKPQDAFD